MGKATGPTGRGTSFSHIHDSTALKTMSILKNRDICVLVTMSAILLSCTHTPEGAIQGNHHRTGPASDVVQGTQKHANIMQQSRGQSDVDRHGMHHGHAHKREKFPAGMHTQEQQQHQEELGPRVQKGINDPIIINEAQWALRHLQGLSESGIYETLTLKRILAAAKQKGVYHMNTFLQVELESPYLLGGIPSTMHEIIVMEALDDGAKSFAIDEFPVMDPEAVEEFWTRMVRSCSECGCSVSPIRMRLSTTGRHTQAKARRSLFSIR
eukprot:gb/GECG01000913.1/.p1 GENE.gb/GECG01000913.1/~~gb/GECG01000913.1/.p1  ORF type:complete len:268 (+),score=23.63 gb/GECG01000913.1/:1-804(+)